MACPDSPEEGYHRFRLAATGALLHTACVYCGTERVIAPFDEPRAPAGRNSGRITPLPSQLPPLIGRAVRS
jgi:hypothetical protein